MSGYLGSLSAQQENVLANVKSVIEPEIPARCRQSAVPFDDNFYLRFCRSRDFKQDEIFKMLRAHFKWRIDNEVHTVRSFAFPELPQVKLIYQHGYHGVDRSGRPIYIERVGRVDMAALLKVTSLDRLMRYYISLYEHHISERLANRIRMILELK